MKEKNKDIVKVPAKYAYKLFLKGRKIIKRDYNGDKPEKSQVLDVEEISEWCNADYYAPLTKAEQSKMKFKEHAKNKIGVFKDFLSENYMVLSFLSIASLYAIGVISHFGNGLVIDKRIENITENMEAKRNDLGEQLAKKYNIDNFIPNSVEVGKQDSKCLLRVFGYTKTDAGHNSFESTYKNLVLEINEENACAITDAIEKRKQIWNSDSINNVDVNYDYYLKLFTGNAKIDQWRDASYEVYDAISNAVAKAYNAKQITVGEASAMNSAIKEEYSLNNDILVANVSCVYCDEELNKSFFYIDTVQNRANTNGEQCFTNCKARVDVEGVDLSVEEVYASFITGQYKNFVELTKSVENNVEDKEIDLMP